MSDNKFTIRIQIQQPHQAIEEIYPDWVEPEVEYEETWNWRRIAAAAVTLLLALSVLVYWLLGSNEHPSSEKQATHSNANPSVPRKDSESSHQQSVQNQTLNQSIQSIPVESQDSVSSELRSASTIPSPGTAPQSTVLDSSIEQFLAPVVQAKVEPESPKPVVIPRQKPKLNNSINTASQSPPPQSSTAASSNTSHVYRAQLTHAIESREPIDDIEQLELQPGESKPVYFYLHLKGLQKKIVRVLWFHDNKLDSRLTLQIHGDDWRTNASKQLDQQRTGAWRVELQDESGIPMAIRNFAVTLR